MLRVLKISVLGSLLLPSVVLAQGVTARGVPKALEERVVAYDKNSSLKEDSLDAFLVCRADLWKKNGEHGRAAIDLSEASRANRTKGSWRTSCASTLLQLGEFDAAIAEATHAIARDDERAYGIRGRAYAAKGEYQRAVADLRESIRSYIYHDALAWLLATCPDGKFRDGKEAVKNAQYACEKDGWKHASQIDVLAAAYGELGNFAQAIKWEQKAIDMTADDAKKPGSLNEQFRARLAQYRRYEPYRDESWPNRIKASAICEDVETYVEKWKSKGKIPEADFERELLRIDHAVQLATTWRKPYIVRARLRLGAGTDLELAIADCDEAARRSPYVESLGDVYVVRGDVFTARKQLDKALADYDTAIELDPGNEDAKGHRLAAKFLKGL